MNCENCQDQLIDFAHGELGTEAHAAVAAHLARCADCALEYCRLQADLQGITAAHDDAAPGAHVFAALREQVAAAIAPPWWRRALAPLRRPVPMYGALLAAALPPLVWLLASPATPPREGTRTPRGATDPTITHYDASAVPLAHRDVL